MHKIGQEFVNRIFPWNFTFLPTVKSKSYTTTLNPSKRKLKSYKLALHFQSNSTLGKRKMAPWHNWQLSRRSPFKSIAHFVATKRTQCESLRIFMSFRFLREIYQVRSFKMLQNGSYWNSYILAKLITRKIWVAENFLDFHTVLQREEEIYNNGSNNRYPWKKKKIDSRG